MPLANLHLLHLSPSLPLLTALKVLSNTSPPPLVLSIPIRWIITPNNNATSPSPLLKTPWSLLYITLAPSLPSAISSHLIEHYHVRVGVPSSLIKDFASKNESLIAPEPRNIPALTGALASPRFGKTSQTIELTPDFLNWVRSTEANAPNNNNSSGPGAWRTGAISMLNFLAFKPGDEAKASYLRYGKAFGESIGNKRGGVAKLVGGVVYDNNNSTSDNKVSTKQEAKEWAGVSRIGDEKTSTTGLAAGDRKWDEFALAHYPSLSHFADMVGSEDYQAVNLKHRVPSLADTCILFTSEVLVREILAEGGGGGGQEEGKRAKL